MVVKGLKIIKTNGLITFSMCNQILNFFFISMKLEYIMKVVLEVSIFIIKSNSLYIMKQAYNSSVYWR